MIRSRLSVIFVAILLVAFPPQLRADEREKAVEHYNRALALEQQKKWDEAIQEYQAAYDASKSPNMLVNIAKVYETKGDDEKAIEIYQRVVAVVPSGGLHDEAVSHVATLNKTLIDRKAAQAEAAQLVHAADADFQAGDYQSSASKYLKALDLSHRPELLVRVAESMRLGGDKRSAVDYYDKYLATAANGPDRGVAESQSAKLKQELAAEDAVKSNAQEAMAAKGRAVSAATSAQDHLTIAKQRLVSGDLRSMTVEVEAVDRAADDAASAAASAGAYLYLTLPSVSPRAEQPSGRQQVSVGISLRGSF